MTIRFGSVCSGIEAASVAWNPLGWQAAWFSEIEPFPCAVLKHHFPDVPNLGDMKQIPEMLRTGQIEAPDILCGGTPCQSFSVAGKRKSLSDARGNLALTFCNIADEIDAVRFIHGRKPVLVFWENVPGVLSTPDNAFGCFLSELVGSEFPICAPEGKFSGAGLVIGRKRIAAWRTLDAQYFGTPQRRRRVFLMASDIAGGGANPAKILFEHQSLQWNYSQSEGKGENSPRRIDDCPKQNNQMNSGAIYRKGGFGMFEKSNVFGTLAATGGSEGGGSETLIVEK